MQTAAAAHRRLFGCELEIESIRAGLECGVIGAKYPDLDMISLGPTVKNAHSPDEHVQVGSVASFWRFLVALIEAV